MKYKIWHSEVTTSVIMGLLFIFLCLSISTILHNISIDICNLLGLVIDWDLNLSLGIITGMPTIIFAVAFEEYLDIKYNLTEDLGWGDIVYKSPYEILNKK